MVTQDSSTPTSQGKQEAAAKVTKDVLSALFKEASKQGLAFRLWNGETLSHLRRGELRATIVLNHPGALRRMFLPPGELTLGEAYLRGDFDIEGDIVAALELSSAIEGLSVGDWISLIRQVLKLPKSEPPDAHLDGRQPARLQGQAHSRERDRAAVTYHYDTGNDFYRLFLGKWMTYSCAYFTSPAVELDAAQESKLEHICRKLRLRPGERLLDIGCGWGGLVVYATEKYGVEALGITLSEPQMAYANEWIKKAGLSDRAQVEVRDYRELETYEPFDKIVSVGMFEHVGREKQMEYFKCAYRALRAGGLFLNHGIATQRLRPPSWFQSTFLQRGQFIDKYVFPDGELLLISDALTFAERAGFEVRDVESLREHYALTLRHWVRNLESSKQAALHLKDERTYRTWRLYMAASAVGFEKGNTSVYQALLSKSTNGNAEVPLTRRDIYLDPSQAQPEQLQYR